LTYGLVKAHGGTLDITSHPGRGTTVTLRFPRIPDPAQTGPPALPAPPFQALRVFLVDDDEDVRFLMTRMLTKAGVRQVRTFAGGEEVLASLRPGEFPDLVILDQNMPGMNGIQAMARIRERCPELPILISSGQPDIESWSILQQPGVAVIAKPFTLDEIQAKLARFALDRASAR
jgi:CheY-like chemotaxis protein